MTKKSPSDDTRKTFKKAKHATATARVAADRQSVAIEFLQDSGAEGYLRFSRDELSRFMRFLAAARATMPESQVKPLDKERLEVTTDPRWWIAAAKNKTGEVFIIEHPGFGPMRFFIPAVEFDKMFTLMQKHHAYMKAGPNNGLR